MVRVRGCIRPSDTNNFSITGAFQDQELIAADLYPPPLTTMALPRYEMGRWAIEKLLAEDSTPEQVMLACPLIKRKSVAPPGR